MRVGEISIEAVHDGSVSLPSSVFANADWSEHRHLLDGDQLVLPVGGFLVRSGNRLGLLDTGIGALERDGINGGALLDSLRALGVEARDIDTVIVSHLHFDHMGWLASNGGPTFANATVHIGAADWEYFVEQEQASSGIVNRLHSVQEQVELVHQDGVTLMPGLTTRMTPGHTPGHMSTVISSGAERMIVLGDALHCPAQLTEIEWEFLYDVDVDMAKRTRAALVAEAETGASLLPCHFPGMQPARLVRTGNADPQWVIG